MVSLCLHGPSRTLLGACSTKVTFSTVAQRSFQSSQALSSSDAAFSYRIAASFSAKGRRFKPDTNVLNFNSLTQKILKGNRPDSGQDAFFVSKLGETGSVALGVADGVGGYSDMGIDPAQFSHGLCEHMAEACHVMTEDHQIEQLRARNLMQIGLQKVMQDRLIYGGGSTACVGIARSNGGLQVANLGDSGFIQIRLNAVHHRSNPQTHGFNFPYQLSMASPQLLAQQRLFGGKPMSDTPMDADVTDHDLRHGDVLVFASDGVWDNLSSSEALRLVSRYMTSLGAWESGDKGIAIGDQLHGLTQRGGLGKHPENTLQALIAVAIASEAKAASMNTKVDGPFAKEIHKRFPRENYRGGKVDDICVVTAIAVQERI
ncbi:MAG: hypothetical protein M1835_006319 [Candelina submexicana]|nr:MAG: hypothetical protein M1835_006319 [Candelina submexicana]